MPLPCPAADTAYLILVRHGATANNLANPPRVQGQHSDPELSDVGREQAKLAADFLAAAKIAAVYSSPLVRARQTAEAIAVCHDHEPTIVDSLRECDVGDWEGRTWEDIERSDPEAHRLFLSNPAEHPYLGGETLTELHQRVTPALEGLLDKHQGELIVVVAHNVVNRVFLAHHMQIPLAKARSIEQHNTGINVFRHRDGKTKSLTVNAAFHLSEW